MILLLIGNDELIKEKAEAIKKSSSFILHDSSVKFNNYREEYEKYINNGSNIIFIKHHLSLRIDESIDKNEIYPGWRDRESEMSENIVVLYFKDSIPPNYDLEFISLRLSRLNWLILNKNTEIKDILDNLNGFSKELRIKKI